VDDKEKLKESFEKNEIKDYTQRYSMFSRIII